MNQLKKYFQLEKKPIKGLLAAEWVMLGYLLLTLLRNLIENAFRFSDGQKVIVKIERSGNCCRFGVADSGRGMTQEEIRRAAEPFYKADKSRSAAGYGIGLSICKSICTLFKTELKFESELGRGTCVSFDLEVTE